MRLPHHPSQMTFDSPNDYGMHAKAAWLFTVSSRKPSRLPMIMTINPKSAPDMTISVAPALRRSGFFLLIYKLRAIRSMARVAVCGLVLKIPVIQIPRSGLWRS